MPGHMPGQAPPGLNGPSGPPHNPFGYGQQQNQGPPPPGGINGTALTSKRRKPLRTVADIRTGYPPLQQAASPAPGKSLADIFRLQRPVASRNAPSNTDPLSPGFARPTPPIDRDAQIGPDFQYSHAELERIGNQLSDLDPEKLPPHLKRVGDDWHVVYNPLINRTISVDLVHSLQHQSVVCCVRFSRDGNFVATGCNKSAQIFDVSDGSLKALLQDNPANEDGDLYIRSVCFSPDGKYLATGAEDKIIRVSCNDHSGTMFHR